MTIPLLLQGIILGFSIAAPVGPIGVLCIRRTLAQGRAHGLASGLGAATADAVYGSMAAFGLTALSAPLLAYGSWIRLVGGLLLLYLGIRTVGRQPAAEAAVGRSRGRGLLGAYGSTVLLTLANPMTILSFTAVFAGFLGNRGGEFGAAAQLVAGVFLGSALWWLLLSGGVGWFGARLGLGAEAGNTVGEAAANAAASLDGEARRANLLRWINRLSGAILIAFGIAILWSLWP